MWKLALVAGALAEDPPELSSPGSKMLDPHADEIVDMSDADLEKMVREQGGEGARTTTAKVNAGPGIKKVIKLLKKMKVEVEDNIESDARQWNKFACYAKNELEATGKSIEELKSKLLELRHNIQAESAGVKASETQIQMATQKIEDIKEAEKKAFDLWKKAQKTYNVKNGSLSSTYNTLVAAQHALSTSGQQLFLQKDAEDFKKTVALVQTLSGKSVNEGGVGKVLGMVVQLKKQTGNSLQTAAREMSEAATSHHDTRLQLMYNRELQEKAKQTYKANRARQAKNLGNYEKERATASALMEDQVGLFDSLKADYQRREAFYNRNYADSGAEQEGIEKALPFLEDLVGGDQEEPDQNMGSASMGSGTALPPGRGVSNFLQTKLSSSVSLATLERSSDKIARALAKVPKFSRDQILPTFLALSSTEKGKAAISGLKQVVNKIDDEIKKAKASIKENEKNKNECNKRTKELELERLDAENKERAADDKVQSTEKKQEVAQERHAAAVKAEGRFRKQFGEMKYQCKAQQYTLKKETQASRFEMKALDSAITELGKIYGAEAVNAMKAHERHSSANYVDKNGKTVSGEKIVDTDFSDQSKSREGGNTVLVMLSDVKARIQKNVDAQTAELENTREECAKDTTEAKETLETLEQDVADIAGEQADLGADYQADETHLTEAETAHQNSIDALETFGNCATLTKEYNKEIAAAQVTIDGMTNVKQTLLSVAEGEAEKTKVDAGLLEVEIDNFHRQFQKSH